MLDPHTNTRAKQHSRRLKALASESTIDAEAGVSGKHLAFIIIGLMLAMFVSSLSETIAATALPTIVGDLGGVEMMQWVTTTYILASTITMPIYGKLGDLIGRKMLIISALIVYTAGKVVCAVAPNMELLIAGRFISGLGGGGLIILSQAIIADVVPPRKRGTYLGLMGAIFGVSSVLGPLLGGWFIQVTGWRMIFWFTVPLAVVAVAALAIFLRKPAKLTGRPPIDIWGIVFLATGVTSLILAISWGGTTYAWDSWEIITLIVVFFVAAVLFVLVERKTEAPIIPMVLFTNRNFVLCSVTGMILYIAFMGAMNYLPTYFQIVDEMSPEAAGMMCLPISFGVFFTSLGTGWIASKTGHYKWMPIAMCVIAAIGFFLISTVQIGTPIGVFLVYLFIMGFGVGLGLQILVLVVQNEFPHAIVGTATAANNFFRQIGSSVGAAAVGALFTSRLTADLASKLPPSDNISLSSLTPSIVDSLPETLRHTIALGYSDALIPLFIYFVPLAVIGFILMLFLKEHPLAKSINHAGTSGVKTPTTKPSDTA